VAERLKALLHRLHVHILQLISRTGGYNSKSDQNIRKKKENREERGGYSQALSSAPRLMVPVYFLTDGTAARRIFKK